MEVDVYKAQKTPEPREKRRYLFIPHGKSVATLPDKVVEQCGRLYFQKTLNLESDEKRIALDTDKAVDEISRNGYHIQDTKISVQISTTT